MEAFEEISSTFGDMSGVGIVKPFDTSDLIARCKDEFGIDLEKEVDCEPSVTKNKK